jgi:hypothetical protein
MKTANLIFASWFGLAALTATVQASPLDLTGYAASDPLHLTDLNPNLAIYWKDLPAASETDIFMIDNPGSTLNWGALGDNNDDHDVKFVSNAAVKAANGAASLKEIYDPAHGSHPTVGAEFLTLDITVPGFQFGDLLFSTMKADSFTVSVFSDAFDLVNPFGTYSFSGLGENDEKFMLLATGPYAITRVLLSAMTGDSFFEVKQFKLSELQTYNGGCRLGPCDNDSTPAVPLPAAFPLFVGALGGLTWLSRSRRRKLSS